MTWTRCPEIQMLAVWGKEVVLRCVWRWNRWCSWYENIGTLISGPEQGHAHTRGPVYNIRERSFKEKGVHPDQMPAVGLVSCVSVLSSRGKYSVWQHIIFMSSSGMASFLSTLGMKAICGREETSPGNCGLLKVTLNYSTSYWGLRPFFCFFEKKKRKNKTGHWWLHFLPYWCPPPWGLNWSAILRFKCSVYIVYSIRNSSQPLA